MPAETRHYRLRIRNRDDTDDLLVATSLRDGVNPNLQPPPSGDGQAFNPVTGGATTGSYSVRLVDVELEDGSRFVTAALADERARQQLLSLRSYIDISEDEGDTWDVMLPGFVNAARKISAIEYEIAIGDTRRKEVSKSMFGKAEGAFSNVTTVIGGPVLEDFAGILENHGGWKFKVANLFSSPGVIRMTLLEGFDPRKSPDTTFSSTSTAIKDYTVDWARSYFQPASTWEVHDIYGHFPQLRYRVVPVGGGDPMFFVPLPRESGGGTWYNPAGSAIDSIISGGTSEIYLPAAGFDEDGAPITFSPSVNQEFFVHLYAIPISEQNPLHIFERPVDLWKKMREAAGFVAGVDFDDTNLAALTAKINARFGGDVFLALRLTKAYQFGEAERSWIFGPFRLSTRVAPGGKIQLFDFMIRGTATPTDVVVLSDLYDPDAGTIFEIEERTIITAIILKQLRFIPWSTDEAKQPDSDSLIARPWPFEKIENSADDIPPGLAESGHEQVIGDIPGTIVYDDGEPIPFEQYMRFIGDEIFQIFGRGAPEGDLYLLPTVDKQIGEQVLVDLPHRPNAIEGRTPTSDNGGPRRCIVIQRTPVPEGSVSRVLDVAIENGGDDGVGDGSEEEEDVTAAVTPVPLASDAGNGRADLVWANSYPQFQTEIEWKSRPPDETVFTPMYGGQKTVDPGIFFDSMIQIPAGFVVRGRIRLTDGVDFSAWSAFSNEAEVTAEDQDIPVGSPINLLASSSVIGEAHGEWDNTDSFSSIQITWQGSVQLSNPTVWNNIAGGVRILPPGTTSDDQPTGAAKFARFRLRYSTSGGLSGNGPIVQSNNTPILE